MSIDKIRTYYGFSKMPFSKDISVSEFFCYMGHKEAVARIEYLIDSNSIGVVTGEVGSGKTVAVRAAVSSIEQSKYTVIYISNPSMGKKGIYTHIVASMGEKPTFFLSQLMVQTEQLFIRELTQRGRRIVIVFDEAHLLDTSQLEELRLLSNSNMDSSSPFSLILVGQLSLKHKLHLATYQALEQRITVKYSMPPMTYEETRSYVAHNLSICGRTDTLFNDDALGLIHQSTRGLPRFG